MKNISKKINFTIRGKKEAAELAVEFYLEEYNYGDDRGIALFAKNSITNRLYCILIIGNNGTIMKSRGVSGDDTGLKVDRSGMVVIV